MDLGVGKMGFLICGKHLLFMTRTQVSDPGHKVPLVISAVYILLQARFLSWMQTVWTLIRLGSNLICVHIVCNIVYIRTLSDERSVGTKVVTGGLRVKHAFTAVWRS